MAFVTLGEARARGAQAAVRRRRSANVVLQEAAPRASYDVFLSHAFADADVILGVKELLEENGVVVSVDWMEHPELDRTKVNSQTADVIRGALNKSKSLVFATSEASPNSKWMPWELGYFDGKRGAEKVSVLPLVANAGDTFNGQEYLGLYRKVERETLAEASSRPYPFRPGLVVTPPPMRPHSGRATLKAFAS